MAKRSKGKYKITNGMNTSSLRILTGEEKYTRRTRNKRKTRRKVNKITNERNQISFRNTKRRRNTMYRTKKHIGGMGMDLDTSVEVNGGVGMDLDTSVEVNGSMEVEETVPLRILTVNLFNGGGKAGGGDFLKKIEDQLPDFILIQEAPNIEKLLKKLTDHKLEYECVSTVGKRTEIMATLRKKDTLWIYVSKETFASVECHTKRVCSINTFIHPTLKIVSIANVHLCGGRIDEIVHGQKGDVLKKAAKESMILPIVNASPDIIVGDFNSNMSVFRNPERNLLDYLMGFGFSETAALQWNVIPYELMTNKGYSYVPVDEPTTAHGTTPDAVWFKEGNRLVNYQVLDLLTTRDSDHNGILVDFEVSRVFKIPEDTDLRTEYPIVIKIAELPLGINFRANRWPKVASSKRFDFINGLPLMKINGHVVQNLDYQSEVLPFMRLIFSDPVNLPFELAFESPLNLTSDLFWKENGGEITNAPQVKQDVLNQALEMTKESLSRNGVVMYSGKLIWEIVLAYISGDDSGCFHSHLPEECNPMDILTTGENSDKDAFKKSVSFSLRCHNNQTETSLGVYLSDIDTMITAGKFNAWFTNNPEFVRYRALFDKFMDENETVMKSRVMTVYTFSDGFSGDHIKLTGNYDNTGWASGLNIPGDNLEEKILFLNKSQALDCRQGFTIQGRLVLDRNRVICHHLFTPEQQVFIQEVIDSIRRID